MTGVFESITSLWKTIDDNKDATKLEELFSSKKTHFQAHLKFIVERGLFVSKIYNTLITSNVFFFTKILLQFELCRKKHLENTYSRGRHHTFNAFFSQEQLLNFYNENYENIKTFDQFPTSITNFAKKEFPNLMERHDFSRYDLFFK